MRVSMLVFSLYIPIPKNGQYSRENVDLTEF